MALTAVCALRRIARWCFVLAILLGQLPAPTATRAQGDQCRPESEPNNVEAEVGKVGGAFCIAGDLPESSDQDLFLWTVSDDDSRSQWAFTVTGPPAVVTDAKIFNLSSEPGVEPVVTNVQIGHVGTTGTSEGPASDSFLFAPGQYLIGVSRTDTADASAPVTTAYQLDVAKADPLPKRLDKEPNDDQSTAVPIAARSKRPATGKGQVEFHAGRRMRQMPNPAGQLHAQTGLGQTITLTITDAAGVQILSAYSADRSVLDLYDLTFEPGTYFIQVWLAIGHS